MKRVIHSVAALGMALFAVLLCASAAQSGELTDRDKPDLASMADNPQYAAPMIGNQGGTNLLVSTLEYSLTRITTITVDTAAAVPPPSGLGSRWQFDFVSQQFLNGKFNLPLDASGITVTVINGAYGIDYAGPTIYITGSQGVYYEYHTDQQVQRFGNQFLISQTYGSNSSLHVIGTVVFTDPYQYIGYTGYAPTQTSMTQLHWDQSFPQNVHNQFNAATWLVDPRLALPELEIITATLHRQFNHIYVSASIHNASFIMAAGAPVFVNLYDRLSPSPPANSLDLTDGWCTLTPVPSCGGASNSPLPALAPNQTRVFTAESDLTAVDGQHYIYLYIDALGIGTQGMNVESDESNNWVLAGTLPRLGQFVFLPLVKR